MLQKAWKNPAGLLLAGTDAEAKLWEQRAIEYWALQGYKYGLVIDLENTATFLQGDLVLSQAVVLHVVPGARVSEKRWREQNPPAKIIAQLGFEHRGRA